MKRSLALALILFLGITGIVFAQDFKGKPLEEIIIAPPQKNLTVGEILQYDIEWLGIPVGSIVLKTEEITKINGRDCYHITGQTMPNRFFRKFYDVEYKVDTYIDTETFNSLRFEKIRRFNDQVTRLSAEFDKQTNKGTYNYFNSQGSGESFSVFSQKKEMIPNHTVTVEVPKMSQDLFSSLYYFRLADIKEGQVYEINICYDAKTWQMKFKIAKPYLKELRKKGSIAVFASTPDSELNKIILGKRKILVYFTADEKRVPVEFSMGTNIGALRGILHKLDN